MPLATSQELCETNYPVLEHSVGEKHHAVYWHNHAAYVTDLQVAVPVVLPLRRTCYADFLGTTFLEKHIDLSKDAGHASADALAAEEDAIWVKEAAMKAAELSIRSMRLATVAVALAAVTVLGDGLATYWGVLSVKRSAARAEEDLAQVSREFQD